jgi:hypothetical protein
MAEFEKTLRWLEPYGGWHKYDTGLCNRIFHWEIAYELTRNNNLEYFIMLEKKFWPELKLIELPKTKIAGFVEGDSHEIEKLKFITIHDTNVSLTKPLVFGNVSLAKSLRFEELNQMFKDQDLSLKGKGDHFYSDFGYTSIDSLYNRLPRNERPLKLIKLRYKHIEDFLKFQMKDMVGIHMRRGHGITATKKDIDTLPKEIRKKYELFMDSKVSEHSQYKFIEDEKYFNMIENMLKISPSQKFYLSSDLPYELFSYYVKRYPNNIVTKEDLMSSVYDYLINATHSKEEFDYGNIAENIVDLFSLSFCKFLVKSNKSTWSGFAQLYSDIPFVHVLDDWDDFSIKDKYKKVFNLV